LITIYEEFMDGTFVVQLMAQDQSQEHSETKPQQGGGGLGSMSGEPADTIICLAGGPAEITQPPTVSE